MFGVMCIWSGVSVSVMCLYVVYLYLCVWVGIHRLNCMLTIVNYTVESMGVGDLLWEVCWLWLARLTSLRTWEMCWLWLARLTSLRTSQTASTGLRSHVRSLHWIYTTWPVASRSRHCLVPPEVKSKVKFFSLDFAAGSGCAGLIVYSSQ